MDAMPVPTVPADTARAGAPGCGALSALPPAVLFRVLHHAALPDLYLDTRLASRGMRCLVVAYANARFRALLAAGGAHALADDLRELQAAARAHPLHRGFWASPHPITHTAVREYWEDVEDAPEPRIPPPDVTVPAAAARVLDAAGFDPAGRNAVAFLVEFAARLYRCGWTESEPASYSEPGPSRFRECAIDLVARFDGRLSKGPMRAFLELGRSLWAPESSHRYRWRYEPPPDHLAAFLRRFPLFSASPELEGLLHSLRPHHPLPVPLLAPTAGPVPGFSASQYWQVLSTVRAWHLQPDRLPALLLPLLRDPGAVAPDTIAAIVEAAADQIRGDDSDSEAEDDAAPTADILRGIATREHFPLPGGYERLARIAMHAAELGMGYRRHGFEAAARVADLFQGSVVPAVLADPGDEGAEELKRCIAAVDRGRHLPRYFAGFVARLADAWVAERGAGMGPLSRWNLEELLPLQCFSMETVFCVALATPNHGEFLPFFRTIRPGGFSDADFAGWKELLQERSVGERQRGRRRVSAVQRALLAGSKEQKERQAGPAKKKRKTRRW
ncbi:hypothetical protein DFJ74DRAFT_769993 [Hyaloraphidium curvatum]|nr:hypothetical protein DFJ74DRAFT_769993 [Hyaloraphidium curvatum]